MREQLVKSKKRVRDHGEVFTPDWLVRDMCDLIPDDVWNNLDATFLEPSCGSGNFVVEILRRKLKLCKCQNDYIRAVKSIYAVELLSDNVAECIQRCRTMILEHGGPDLEHLLQAQIIQGNFLDEQH